MPRTPRARQGPFRHPAQAVTAGFLAVIFIGAGLLCIPGASTAQGSPPFVEALFTATSAVTVTGLTTVDTATYWTPFGQGVILALIQLGGLGIMTSASLLFLAVARRLNLRGSLRAQTEVHALGIGDLRRLLVFILAFTIAIEVIASTVLAMRLWLGAGRDLPTAWWEGAFHGVSAFNNAGFSLYSDNLMGFATDGWFLITVALAVIAGGLGFPVWLELVRRPRQPRRWTVHAKLTLATTGALLAFGTIAMTLLEWSNPATFGGQGTGARLLGGFFAGVMPRTAGFNAIDYGEAGADALLVTDMLMVVGGGSGGTAGGLKVTTFALLFLIVWAELRGDREVSAFRRSIPQPVQRQALTIAVLGLNAVVLATLVIMATSDLPLHAVLFETISAFATVGLSTGITPELNGVGQAVVIPLMLIGRIGPLTLGAALVLRERERRFTHPEERPLVG